ncbi:MAG TPA: hypothetical protein VHA35_22820, partial [Dongiaceae bacterium]|nr:hypothetical protein [Dongiaceae bacterium]
MSNISGAGGNKVISVAAGDNLTVDSFGAFGTGAAASQPGELDTLKFTAAGMTAANLQLTQSGSNVVITFDGDAATQVTLTNTTIDQLENIVGQGNFMFAGQSTVTESIDIFSAPVLATVQHTSTVTFLSPAADLLDGKDASSDIIHGAGGNDVLAGLGSAD